MKTFVIIKIGENLSCTLDSTRLHESEPEAFAKVLREQGNRVIVHAKCMHKSFAVNGNDNMLFHVDNIINIENVTDKVDGVFLWQGFKFIPTQETGGQWLIDVPANSASYQLFNDIIDKYPDANPYFVQTDLRLPLFDLSHIDKKNTIDISKVTLLSQAKIDYRFDIDRFTEFEASGTIQTAAGGKWYSKFGNFRHLQLGVLPALGVISESGEFLEPVHTYKCIYTTTFFTQGYGLLKRIRKQLFRDIFCDNDLNDEFSIAVFGSHDAFATSLLEKDLEQDMSNGLSRKQPHFAGKVDWSEVTNELHQSISQVCINNESYELYGLIPNRIFETIAAGSLPLLINCTVAMDLFGEMIYDELVFENNRDLSILLTEFTSNHTFRDGIVECLQETVKNEIITFKQQLLSL